MFANKKKEFISEDQGWLAHDLSPLIIKALELNGYDVPFNYFKQNWKKIQNEMSLFIPYLQDETESKNALLAISCLNFIKTDAFNVQCLIIFPDDEKAIEFYGIFEKFIKRIKGLETALILEQNKIVDDRYCLTKENSEIIIGSVKRIDYVIKKHYLNVFLIKNLIIDLNFNKEGLLGKEAYEDILTLMPESSKKIIFYEENEFFKKKLLKNLEKL